MDKFLKDDKKATKDLMELAVAIDESLSKFGYEDVIRLLNSYDGLSYNKLNGVIKTYHFDNYPKVKVYYYDDANNNYDEEAVEFLAPTAGGETASVLVKVKNGTTYWFSFDPVTTNRSVYKGPVSAIKAFVNKALA